MSKPFALFVLLLAGLAIGYFVGYDRGFERAAPLVTSFAECAAAGYPIMESYPRQCRTPEGETFVEETNGVFCTADAKLCPDGSYVGRVPPMCEFTACPAPSGTSGIRGMVLVGPTCPVERIPPDPACADKPYAANLVVTTPEGAQVVTTLSSSANGTFSVPLAPGEYAIRSAAAANVLPYCASEGTITVQAGAYADVTVHCDSGIR